LSSRQARGGVIGGRGYSFQAAYIVSRMPRWLEDSGFAQFLQEGAGDVDVRFNREGDEARWYVQVKDHRVIPSEARDVFEQFRATDAGSPATYTRFTLACAGLNADLKSLRDAIEDLRGAKPFFRRGQDDVVDNTWADLEKKVEGLDLPVSADFLVSKVHFDTDMAGLTDDESLQDLFVGRLLKLDAWKEVTPRGAAHAYEKLALLSHQKIRWTCSREQIEQLIRKAVGELPASMAYVHGVPSPPAPYLYNPYPAQAHFTGRRDERAALTHWLRSGEQPLYALIAMGGMGKSALAWHWLQYDVLEADEPLDGVLWWSFYDRESGFDRFLERAVAYASGGDLDAAGWSTREKMDCLRALLSERRVLLVLDGVERLLRAYARMDAAYVTDEDVDAETGPGGISPRQFVDYNAGRFFQWLAGLAPSRTLLTSRLFPCELEGLAGVQRRDLKGMAPADAVRFFRALGVRGTRVEIQAACRPYGYLPLALRLLAGLVSEDPARPGDIAVAIDYAVADDLRGRERHHILARAYAALEDEARALLSRIAAFRSPVEYDVLAALFGPAHQDEEESEGFRFSSRRALKEALRSLVKRGLLQRQEATNRYDLHPVVRGYAYDRLGDGEGVHARLRDYFAALPEPEQVAGLDDLAPTIELYHHTVRAGRYDEACDLYQERLNKTLYYRFGAYGLIIELLSALFPGNEPLAPSGEAALLRLSDEAAQAWTLNELANAYALSGQPGRAAPLFEAHNTLQEKAESKKNLAIGLGNLAYQQTAVGALAAAEENLQRRIALCREIEDAFNEAAGHQALGRLLAYCGAFEEAEEELETVLEFEIWRNNPQGLGVNWLYRALRALLLDEPDAALDAARRAHEIASGRQNERDRIRAEWLLGAAHRARGALDEADPHLQEALRRCRRINMVDHEPHILLSLARLRRHQEAHDEALSLAEEALAIADRCGYRLNQADAHVLLARLALDKGDPAQARRHAETARERAWCDGPPHRYAVAFQKAERLLAELASEKT
jgi:tetratricopeptide (TPR) repeat protein